VAEQKTAAVVRIEDLSPDTRLLTLSLTQGDHLGFIGGQYIIVDSGLPLPGGKIAKRAYSILSSDREQNQFQIAVRRIGAGLGSNYLHGVKSEMEIRFSGPWGKLFQTEKQISGKTWIIATDTGITAALGLVQSEEFRSRNAATRLTWWIPSLDYFLPEGWVEKTLGYLGVPFDSESIEPVEKVQDRIATSVRRINERLDTEMPAAVYLIGDGNVLYAAKEAFLMKGIPPAEVQIESFFNNPLRKATS